MNLHKNTFDIKLIPKLWKEFKNISHLHINVVQILYIDMKSGNKD